MTTPSDANVHIILTGENGDSGKRKLENASRNLFGKFSGKLTVNIERNQIDEFGFDVVELGAITKITIGHDGKIDSNF